MVAETPFTMEQWITMQAVMPKVGSARWSIVTLEAPIYLSIFIEEIFIISSYLLFISSYLHLFVYLFFISIFAYIKNTHIGDMLYFFDHWRIKSGWKPLQKAVDVLLLGEPPEWCYIWKMFLFAMRPRPRTAVCTYLSPCTSLKTHW